MTMTFRGASVLALAVAGALAAPLAQAQTQSAADSPAAQSQSVAGVVLDDQGRGLPGARVTIVETGAQAVTDRQGYFAFTTAPAAGEVTLQVDYIGRETFTQRVAPGERGNAVLVAPGEATIIVTGAIASGTVRALNQQRNADNATNVLSADDVGRFPDPNIAEALQRVVGISIERDQGEGRYINVRGAPAEFSAVAVDGVAVSALDPTTRAVDLDTLPSDIINSLEVTKTLLPSQNADSISGAINVVTRSAFDSRRSRVNASFGGSINQYGGSDVRGSAFASTRFGADRNIGIVVSGSYSRTDRQVDNVESVWDVLTRPEGGEVFGIIENLFKDYDTRRERWAVTGGIEAKPTPESRIYLRGSFARFKDDEFRNRLGIIWEDGELQPGATDTTATFTKARLEKQFRHRVQQNEILTVTAGGEHRLGTALVDYSGSYSTSDQFYPRRNELLFRSSLRPTLSYDYSNPDNPAFSLFRTGEHLQTDRYAFRENTFRNNITNNEEWSARGNIALPVPMGSNELELRAGLAWRDRSVVADEERQRDRAAGSAPALTLPQMLSGQPSQNYDYFLGRKINPDLANAYLDAQRSRSPRRMPDSITADYTADEQILAGYVMARADFGATDVIAGVRVERTAFDGAAPTFNDDTGAIGEAAASARYTNVFPNLTIRHAFTENLLLRAALTRGINRPNFVDLVPRVVEETDGNLIVVESGNPELQPTLSNNADLALEYYVEPLGLISIAGFYKDLSDYRYTLTRAGTYRGQDALFTRPENAPDGSLYGFEVAWNQKFTFLPGFLSHFGVFANYTYTEADINVASPYAGRSVFPLPGQSKHTYNASVYFENDTLSARLSYTDRSDYLDEINADVPALDLYWEGRGQLDFTASAQVTPNFTAFFEAKNLTNSPGVRYFGSRERVYEYERFGYTLFSGIKLNF